MYLCFQLEHILRFFKVMKIISKKCISIVKGTSYLTSTMYANFGIRRSYRYSIEKMCSLENGYDQNEMQRIFVSKTN